MIAVARCQALPKQHNPQAFRWDDQHSEIRSILISELNDGRGLSLLIDDCVRLCCSLCRPADDLSVIEPDVLSKDGDKFEASGDAKYVDKSQRRGKIGWTAHGVGLDWTWTGGAQSGSATGQRGPSGIGGEGAEWVWRERRMTSEQGLDKDDYSEHFDEPSLWAKLSHGALDAGRRVVELTLTLFFCFRDPETPMRAKAVIASALGYFILPLDAIPDFTPVVGFADDLGALMMAAAVIAAHIKPKHRQQARQKLREYFGDQADTDDQSGQPASSPS